MMRGSSSKHDEDSRATDKASEQESAQSETMSINERTLMNSENSRHCSTTYKATAKAARIA